MAKGFMDSEAIRLSQRLDKVLNHYYSQTQVPYRKA
ncbi:aspartyl-phosphate phosphatase Spo0E family protein [Ammoniphilus sp. YIM 78166]